MDSNIIPKMEVISNFTHFGFGRMDKHAECGFAKRNSTKRKMQNTKPSPNRFRVPQSVLYTPAGYSIYIVSLGVKNAVLQQLQQAIADTFNIKTKVISSPFDVSIAFDPSRNQYNSTLILSKLIENLPPDAFRVLGVTDVDLFIPILTFVFGEAQLSGPTAVVSLYRLRNEFYGLSKNEKLLQSRLIKESIHELGHTFGILHCDDYECVMHSSTYVEEVDLKSDSFCPPCSKLIR